MQIMNHFAIAFYYLVILCSLHYIVSSLDSHFQKRKLLIVTSCSDNSHKNDMLNHIMSLNLHYAKRYDYDYIVLNDFSIYDINILKKLNLNHDDYNQISKIISSMLHGKRYPYVINFHTKEIKSYSWFKIPCLWYAMNNYSLNYDYLLFLDSHTFISSFQSHQSLDEILLQWQKKLHHTINITNIPLLLFSDHPKYDNLPSLSAFLINTNYIHYINQFFMEWWNYYDHMDDHHQGYAYHNQYNEFEIFYFILIHSSFIDKQSKSYPFYSLIPETLHISSYVRYEDLFLIHIDQANMGIHSNVMVTNMLIEANLDISSRYTDHLNKIEKYTIDSYSICHDMAAFNVSADYHSRYESQQYFEFIVRYPHIKASKELLSAMKAGKFKSLSSYPISFGSTELTISQQYEGRLLEYGGHIWLVKNGYRREFANTNEFQNMGFQKAQVFHLSLSDTKSISPGLTVLRGKDESCYHRQCENNNPRNCGKEDLLDQLVRTDGTRSTMYLYVHDDESYQVAESFMKCRKWVHITKIRSTKYFESINYVDLYPHLIQKDEWKAHHRMKNEKSSIHYSKHIKHDTIQDEYQYDFIITGTTHGMQRKGESITEIYRLLMIGKRYDYDVLPFKRGSELMKNAVKFHTEAFRTAWDYLLMRLGFNRATIRKYDNIHAFYCNIFIIKPKVLIKLTSFMNRAIDIASSDETLQSLLAADSLYDGNPLVAMKIFNQSNYEMYPFVFERLPAFYLYYMQYKICSTDSSPPCPIDPTI